jgi:hypothetical protein
MTQASKLTLLTALAAIITVGVASPSVSQTRHAQRSHGYALSRYYNQYGYPGYGARRGPVDWYVPGYGEEGAGTGPGEDW